jgi:hypothetical protein
MTKPSPGLPGADESEAITTSDEKRRRKVDLEATTLPVSGAPIGAALAGASMSADEEELESEAALKAAARKARGDESRELESKPDDRRGDGPDAIFAKRREPNPDAPSRLSVEKARVGNGLSADPLDYDEAESTEALKRTVENERPT